MGLEARAVTNLIRSRRAQALTPPLHSQLEGVKWRVAPLRLAMRGWDVSSTADCGRQRWAMGDERSYLDLHSFPRPLRTELRTNRHACALAVMISLRGAMPLEGAVLPQLEAESAVLGLARPLRLPHASASSESNPDDCLGRGQPPIRSFAQTLFIIPGLQLPFIGREIGLRAFFCAWTPRIAQVFFLCFVLLAFRGHVQWFLGLDARAVSHICTRIPRSVRMANSALLIDRDSGRMGAEAA